MIWGYIDVSKDDDVMVGVRGFDVVDCGSKGCEKGTGFEMVLCMVCLVSIYVDDGEVFMWSDGEDVGVQSAMFSWLEGGVMVWFNGVVGEEGDQLGRDVNGIGVGGRKV